MKEWFEFSKSRKSVRRIVQRTDGCLVKTVFRLKERVGQEEDAHAMFDGTYLRRSRPTPLRSLNQSTIRVVDLFCGCGGLSLGAREACAASGNSFLPIMALDVDIDSLSVYASNFSCENTILHDIEDVIDGGLGDEPTDHEHLIMERCGKVDILLAGPPCQGHSNLNNHTRRIDGRNVLYERVARFAEITLPTHILIENVPAAIHDEQRAVQRTIDTLHGLGYKIDSEIVDLTRLGVPQRRKRHVVLASLQKTPSIEDVIRLHRVVQVRDVMWAIDDLEFQNANGIFSTPSSLSEDNRKRVKYLHDSDIFDLPNLLRPNCHSHGNHSYKSMYGRLRPNEPAQTITGGFGSPGQGRFVHPTMRRVITPHEAARLQFFPDFIDFSSVKKRTSLARMIGNAVPMKLSYVFCLDFLN